MSQKVGEIRDKLIQLYHSEQYSEAYEQFLPFETTILENNIVARSYWLAVLICNSKFTQFLAAVRSILQNSTDFEVNISTLISAYQLAKIVYAHQCYLDAQYLKANFEYVEDIEIISKTAKQLLAQPTKHSKRESLKTILTTIDIVDQYTDYSRTECIQRITICNMESGYRSLISISPLLQVQLFCFKRLWLNSGNSSTSKKELVSQVNDVLLSFKYPNLETNEFGITTSWQFWTDQERKPLIECFSTWCREIIAQNPGDSVWINMLCRFTERYFHDEYLQNEVYQLVVESFSLDTTLNTELFEDIYFDRNSILTNLKKAFINFDLVRIGVELRKLEVTPIITIKQLIEELSNFLEPLSTRLYWIYNYHVWKVEPKMACITAKLLAHIEIDGEALFKGMKYCYFYYATLDHLKVDNISETRKEYEQKLFRTREATDPLMLHDVMPFGKYKGQIIEDIIHVDTEYLLWCLRTIDDFYLSAITFYEVWRSVPRTFLNKTLMVKNTLMNVWFQHHDEYDYGYEEDQDDLGWEELGNEEMRSMDRDSEGWWGWNID